MFVLALLPPRLPGEVGSWLWRCLGSRASSVQLLYPRSSHSPVLGSQSSSTSLLFPVEDPEIPSGLQLPPLVTGSVRQRPRCPSVEISLAGHSGSHRVTRHLKGKGLIVVEGEYEVHLAT